MSGTDIAGIVISVMATLISFGALIYTIYSDHQNKGEIKEAKQDNEKNDKEIKQLKKELNDLTREQNKIFSSYFEKFHKDFQEMNSIKNEVRAKKEKDILSKEGFAIQHNQSQLDSQEKIYEWQRKQDKKAFTEQKRKNSATQHIKK